MYRLESYSILENVIPAKIMYHLASYHNNDNLSILIDQFSGLTSTKNSINQNDESELQRIVRDQNSIIDQLVELEKHLKALNLQKSNNAKVQTKKGIFIF